MIGAWIRVNPRWTLGAPSNMKRSVPVSGRSACLQLWLGPSPRLLRSRSEWELIITRWASSAQWEVSTLP